MLHQMPLVATVMVVGIALAFAVGGVAHRLRVSPLVGYPLAGVALRPFTPGIVADHQSLAAALADIGAVLLPFPVGLHFSVGKCHRPRQADLPTGSSLGIV